MFTKKCITMILTAITAIGLWSCPAAAQATAPYIRTVIVTPDLNPAVGGQRLLNALARRWD